MGTTSAVCCPCHDLCQDTNNFVHHCSCIVSINVNTVKRQIISNVITKYLALQHYSITVIVIFTLRLSCKSLRDPKDLLTMLWELERCPFSPGISRLEEVWTWIQLWTFLHSFSSFIYSQNLLLPKVIAWKVEGRRQLPVLSWDRKFAHKGSEWWQIEAGPHKYCVLGTALSHVYQSGRHAGRGSRRSRISHTPESWNRYRAFRVRMVMGGKQPE